MILLKYLIKFYHNTNFYNFDKSILYKHKFINLFKVQDIKKVVLKSKYFKHANKLLKM